MKTKNRITTGRTAIAVSAKQTETSILNREDGMKLLRQFRSGLKKRSGNFGKFQEASGTCLEVTKKLLPFYEEFPDLKEKAEGLVEDWHIVGVSDVYEKHYV